MDPTKLKKASESIVLPPLDNEDDASSVGGALGVKAIEASEQVWGKYSRWCLFAR